MLMVYILCLGKEHCTRYFVVRWKINDYAPEQSQKVSRTAADWLRFRAYIDREDILK